MIDLSFEIGGQEVHLDQIENEEEKATLQQVADDLRKSLNYVRCPQHWELPQVTVKGETIDDLYFEVK